MSGRQQYPQHGLSPICLLSILSLLPGDRAGNQDQCLALTRDSDSRNAQKLGRTALGQRSLCQSNTTLNSRQQNLFRYPLLCRYFSPISLGHQRGKNSLTRSYPLVYLARIRAFSHIAHCLFLRSFPNLLRTSPLFHRARFSQFLLSAFCLTCPP